MKLLDDLYIILILSNIFINKQWNYYMTYNMNANINIYQLINDLNILFSDVDLDIKNMLLNRNVIIRKK